MKRSRIANDDMVCILELVRGRCWSRLKDPVYFLVRGWSQCIGWYLTHFFDAVKKTIVKKKKKKKKGNDYDDGVEQLELKGKKTV